MEEWIKKISALAETNQVEFFHDLNSLMEIPSVKGHAEEAAPFGKEPKNVLLKALGLARSYGFEVELVDDAVGYAQWGIGEEHIGIVGHLDVVPAGNGWDYPPFQLSIDGARLYGRGILDNKGPIFSCLFGMKLLKENGFVPDLPIRIIFGTDEESGCSDIPLYLNKEKAPLFGFTPDCKYPVVYGERGIVNYELKTTFSSGLLAELGQIEGDQAKDHVPDDLSVSIGKERITVTGKRAPTNAPEMGNNAITLLAEQLSRNSQLSTKVQSYFDWLFEAFHDKHFGQGLSIAFEDEDSGKLIVTPYMLQKSGDTLTLSFAIRYPVSFTEEAVTAGINAVLPADSELMIVRSIKGTNFPKEHVGVQLLSKVYEEVTQSDGEPVTTTGATYARWVPNIVAFGPSFPGQKGIAHNKNEYMDIVDLMSNMKIYMLSMLTLSKNLKQ